MPGAVCAAARRFGLVGIARLPFAHVGRVKVLSSSYNNLAELISNGGC